MADDITERLREMATRCWCTEKSQGEPVGKPFFRCESCDDQLRAADEIEHLRALLLDVAEWAEHPHHCIKSVLVDGTECICGLGELLTQIKEEARRG